MWLRIVIIMLSLCVTSPVVSKEKLKVAFGNALAPWVIPETHNGIIIDLITEALEPAGYEIIPLYYPYARRIKSYKSGLVDATCDMNINTIQKEGLVGFFTDEAYTYENFAVSLKEKGYQFKHLNELGNLRLLSWQGAIAHLGDEYAKMASNNPYYREIHDQESQVKMLFRKHIDVIQLDKQIFKHYRAKIALKGKIDTMVKVDRFPLFGKSPNGFLFRSSKIRNKFNQQLKRLKESGQYDAIFERY